MKKSKATSKGTIRKPAKKHSRKAKKPVDLVEVRKNITKIVSSEATGMTKAVVGEALKGQLAPVKYLFEVSGLYPPTPATEGKPAEDSLAHTLLKHLGLPTEPVVSHEDEFPVGTVAGAASEEPGENTPAKNQADANSPKNAGEAETSGADEPLDAAPVVVP